MTRIKIKDLPRNVEINSEEMKMVMGGASYFPIKLKADPGGFLILDPEHKIGAYNAPYFSLRKSEIL